MRWPARLLPLALIGCAFQGRGQPDDGVDPDEQLAVIRDDTAADFAQSPTLDEATIAARGALEPEAFARGGLRARAFVGLQVTATSTWQSTLEAIAATPSTSHRGTAYGQLPTDWSNGHPLGLGLTLQNDTFTVLYEGEILLDAGPTVVKLDADDTGFLEIDTGAGFGNLLRNTGGGASTTTVDVPAGWYAIRLAVADAGGNAKLELELDDVPVTRGQLRARVTQDRGLVVQAFDRFRVNRHGAVVLASTEQDFGLLAPPFDFAALSNAYELRFTGQFYVDVAGSYTLTPIASDPGDLIRVWIDRHEVAAIPDFGSRPPSATLDLAVGWHDLLLDLAAAQNRLNGTPDPHIVTTSLHLTPPGGTAAPIPVDRLRPVVASGVTTADVEAVSGVALADASGATPGVTTIELAPPPLDGAVIDAADVVMILAPATLTDYTVVLRTDTSDLPVPVAATSFTFLQGDETLAGRAMPTAPWSLVVTDTVEGGPLNPKIYYACVALTGHGGLDQPFAPMWSYTSSPRPTPRALRFGRARLAAESRGAVIALQLRTAATAELLEQATWINVVPDTVVAAPISELVQYRISVISDGWQLATIDRVEIEYVVPRDPE